MSMLISVISDTGDLIGTDSLPPLVVIYFTSSVHVHLWPHEKQLCPFSRKRDLIDNRLKMTGLICVYLSNDDRIDRNIDMHWMYQRIHQVM